MREVVAQLDRWAAGGRRAATATVVRAWGSAPCPAGTELVVAG
jgi:xanthine/CO dehydrogenase XdhC/CoxF family maturation factor